MVYVQTKSNTLLYLARTNEQQRLLIKLTWMVMTSSCLSHVGWSLESRLPEVLQACSIVEAHLGTYTVGALVVTGSPIVVDTCSRHPNPPLLPRYPPLFPLVLRVPMRVRVGQVGVL